MASSTQRVEAALERWAREVYGKAQQKGALRQPEFKTTSGIELLPLYGPREGGGSCFVLRLPLMPGGTSNLEL